MTMSDLCAVCQPITTQCHNLTHFRYIAGENIVRKGEIACCEHFLFFPSVFKRLVLQTCKTQGLFGKGLIQW